MRLKDLRWYILASVILIISYAAIAVCYYVPIRAKAESSMKVLGLEATENIAQIAESKVNSLYDAYMVDSSVCEYVSLTAVESKFRDIPDGERKIVFTQHKQFTNNLSSDTNYYFYFLNTNLDVPTCGRVSAATIFEFISNPEENENIFDTFIYSKDGTIYYENTGNNYFFMLDVLNTSKFDLLNESDTFNSVYTIDNQNGVLSAVKFFNVYVSTFIPINNPYLAIEWVMQQALIFYICGIFVAIGMLAILILGCKKASKLLRADRHAVQKTNAVVIRIDLDGKVIFTNKTFKQIFGIRKIENVDNIIDVDTGESILNTVKEHKAFECSIEISDEEVRYFSLTPLQISQSYYLMGTDITIDYLRRKHLFLMSGRNEITNCDNQFSLTNNYKHIVLNSSFYDIAFVEYNISKYEEIIGLFGRTNFNILLNDFLTIIHETFTDLAIYHINDAKFIVVFPNLNIEEVTDKIKQSLDILRRPFQIRQNHIYIKCKIVVYNLKKEDANEVSLDTIQNKLELALKNIADFSTKDYIVYEPAMDNVIEAAGEMEKDLINGLASDEFAMYLQPQYDVISNRIDGFEALIRWVNPKYIDKSPQVYIELAEQRGYMLDIGRYVVKETFKLAKLLEPYNVHVSMNVSPIQLLQVGFVQQLIDEFKVLRLKPGSIAIEITETFLMGNFQLMTEKLKRLKEMGFHIHLDDFCTGYSSMLYLKDLPVDTLKIDKEFTKYIETNKVHASIVKTICQLGTSLDMDIICEGVENQAQSDLAKRFGARLIQGYLIGKAVPYEEAIELLDKYNGKRK
ncbi:MAG: EAL domain-containing protein [Erysipelotrichaceae bacterium]|nr:EAL domain-containing protein [Erysipelotrichaceae bacterium]